MTAIIIVAFWAFCLNTENGASVPIRLKVVTMKERLAPSFEINLDDICISRTPPAW